MINEWWALVSQIGLWGWIFSMLAFIFKVFPQRNAYHGRAGLFLGAACIVFFATWVLGMVCA